MVEILHAIGELAATKSFERLDALCQTDIVALPTAEKITLAGALIDKINEVDDQLADFNLEVIRTGLRGGSWEPTPEKQALLNLDDALLTALTYSLMPQTDEERTVFAHDNLWPKLSSLAMGEYSKKKTAYPPLSSMENGCFIFW